MVIEHKLTPTQINDTMLIHSNFENPNKQQIIYNSITTQIPKSINKYYELLSYDCDTY